MRNLLAVLFLVLLACTQRPAYHDSDIAGAWFGSIDVPPGIKLRVVFHIAGFGNDLTATMDSLDQNAKEIPVSKATHNGNFLLQQHASGSEPQST